MCMGCQIFMSVDVCKNKWYGQYSSSFCELDHFISFLFTKSTQTSESLHSHHFHLSFSFSFSVYLLHFQFH